MPGCGATVWFDDEGFPSLCSRSGILLEAGQYWCQQHAPSTKLAQKVARAARHTEAAANALRNQEIVEAREEVIREVKEWSGIMWNNSLYDAVQHLKTLEATAMKGDDDD